MAAKVQVRGVTPWDIAMVTRGMRAADRAEVELCGLDPCEGLQRSVEASSEAFCVDIDGQPSAIFGLAPSGAGVASPWLLGTDRLTMAPVSVARRARRIVAAWARMSALENWCDARNGTALTFLVWLGFTVEARDGRALVRFSMPKAVR